MTRLTKCQFLHYCWQKTFWISIPCSHADTQSRRPQVNSFVKILCSKLTHTSIECQFTVHIFIITQVYVCDKRSTALHASCVNCREGTQIGSNENRSPMLTRWVRSLSHLHCVPIDVWVSWKQRVCGVLCVLFLFEQKRDTEHLSSVVVMPNPTFCWK